MTRPYLMNSMCADNYYRWNNSYLFHHSYQFSMLKVCTVHRNGRLLFAGLDYYINHKPSYRMMDKGHSVDLNLGGGREVSLISIFITVWGKRKLYFYGIIYAVMYTYSSFPF